MKILFQLVFLAVFALIVGRLIFSRRNYGSWSNAMLGGTIQHTFGEVSLQGSAAGVGGILKVVEMLDGNRQRSIALVITDKSRSALSTVHYRLLKEQAGELASLLALATQ